MHAAILQGDVELVKGLIAYGANPNTPVDRPTSGRRSSTDLVLPPAVVGVTPFWLAAHFGEPQIMQVLAAGGADPRIAKPTSDANWVRAGGEANYRAPAEPAGTTSLMAAVTNENRLRRPLAVIADQERVILDAVKLAADLGVDVNAANAEGDVALHRAAKLRLNSVVQFLADRGASLDVKNKDGQTPLALAKAANPRGRGAGNLDANKSNNTEELLRKLGAKQ